MQEKNAHDVNLILEILLHALGLSRDAELSKLLNHNSAATISNWRKRGFKSMDHYAIITLCEQRQISCDYIFGIKRKYEEKSEELTLKTEETEMKYLKTEILYQAIERISIIEMEVKKLKEKVKNI
jgi:hypothetical protein